MTTTWHTVVAFLQKFWQTLGWKIALVIAVAGLIWAILKGYSEPWTGFADFTKPTSDFVRGKTLWDWMQLLVIPIMLAIGAFLLNRSERKNESQRAEERSRLEREIATDRQQESALQTYLDRMADLLLKEKLRVSENAEVGDVARIRTLTVLRGLDEKRKGIVLLFLYESGLIIEAKSIIRLRGADLTKADLRGANLGGADLINAYLTEAGLEGADLRGAKLIVADLREAKLFGADLREADLTEADLTRANLTEANLFYANLISANLSGANLTRAKVSNFELQKAGSLENAIMPDGSKHEGKSL